MVGCRKKRGDGGVGQDREREIDRPCRLNTHSDSHDSLEIRTLNFLTCISLTTDLWVPAWKLSFLELKSAFSIDPLSLISL